MNIKSKIKYYAFCLLGYSPVIIGTVVLMYVWFIQLPFKSTYYYYSPVVTCNVCEVELSSAERFCPICSKSVTEVAILHAYKHCDYCESNALYRNDNTQFCQNCGNLLTETRSVNMRELGFNSVQEFRNALTFDNLQRLLNNKIITTLVIIGLTVIIKNAIYSTMLKAAKRKILRDGLRKKNEIE